jgi:lipopolysaccharide transport system ATP-binding protein
MSQIVIRTANLSKRYQLGAAEERYQTFRQAIAETAATPFRRLRKLRGTPEPEATLWALKDVSVEIDRGEVIGVIGANGAGKSTLLKILSRITEPTAGRAEIRGRVAALLEVGTGFHSELTGRENIYLNGSILGMTRREIQRKFDEILDFAGVTRFIDTPVKRYSSGMYLRLAFAVAAHLEPDIMIVDELLAVGDAGFQKKCLGKMEDVARSGRTVLFVSHNMAAIQALCTHGILLDRGCVALRGDAHSVIQAYLRSAESRREEATADLSSVPRDHRMKVTVVQGQINGRPLIGDHPLMPLEDVTFDLTIELPQRMRQCTLGIHLQDEYGITICAANTRWQLKRLDLPEGRHNLSCVLRAPSLVPGQYYVSIGFSADGQQVDWLERVTTIEFLTCDIYGTGELPFHGQGYYLSRCDWTVSTGEVHDDRRQRIEV